MIEHICSCGAQHRFPETAVGKRARCKNCGEVFRIEEDAPLAVAELEDDGPVMQINASAVTAPVAAAGAGRPGSRAGSSAQGSGPWGPFFADIGKTFLFPSSLRNIIIFICGWVALLLGVFCQFAPCIGVIGAMFVYGCYAAYKFEVVQSAASHEEELPAFDLSDGIFHAVIIPALKMMGSWLIVFLPAIAYLFLTHQVVSAGVLQSFMSAPAALVTMGAVLAVLLIVGLFVWPMVILCISVGGFASLNRPDLILKTIIKTFPAYVITAAVVLGAAFLLGYLEESVMTSAVEGSEGQCRQSHGPPNGFVCYLSWRYIVCRYRRDAHRRLVLSSLQAQIRLGLGIIKKLRITNYELRITNYEL